MGDVKVQFDNDVFCPAAALQGKNVGDVVEFELQINEKGQPQAKSVQAIDQDGDPSAKKQRLDAELGELEEPRHVTGASQSKSTAQATGETYFGTIKVIGAKFGFIECPEVKAVYDNDVFCPGAA